MPNKIESGIVIKKSSDKTVVVRVSRKMAHPVCGKLLNKYSNIKVHDEKNVCVVGDDVQICYSRPYSKTKSHRIFNKGSVL